MAKPIRIKQDRTVKFFISFVGLVVIALTLRELSHIFIPFVIAYFLFFVFSPLNAFFEHRKVPMFLIVLLDIIITVFILYWVLNFIISSVSQFVAIVPQYENKLNDVVRSAARSIGISDPYFKNFSLARAIKGIDFKLLAGDLFTSTFSLVGYILFVLFFFVFVVTGHETILDAIRKRFIVKKVDPEIRHLRKTHETEDHIPVDETEIESQRQTKEEKLAATFKAITGQIQRYIIAKIAINSAAGISITFALMILKVDFPIIWGLFTFLLNFIPSIGSAIALALPVMFVLLQSASTTYTVITAIIIAAIQTIFFNLLEPMVIGRRLNLNPLLVLLSVLVWGYIWGVVGMLLAVPLTAIIKIIISNSESKDMNFLGDLMSN